MRQFLKSQTDQIHGFEALVALHAAAMKAWRAHMSRAAGDEKNGVIGIEKHWPLDRPLAHPSVEAAVNENDEPDYEIVDDGPTPEQVLVHKKRVLIGRVTDAENAAYAAVVPTGKRRLFDIREADIRQGDAQLAAELSSKNTGVLAAITSAVGLGGKDASDVAAIVEESRSDEDTRHLAEQDDRRKRLAAIERVAAQAHHDIEDLTIDTVDGWSMPEFPT